MMMTMKSGLSGPFLLLLLLSSTASGLGSVVSKYYSHIHDHVTWQEAQSRCRNSYSYNDLATIYRQSDADGINLQSYSAWIGLQRSVLSSSSFWYWSDGQFASTWNWATDEPYQNDDCGCVNSPANKFYGTYCGKSLFFICHKDSRNHFDYTFIPQSKTWSDAREYCRDNYDDLATIEDSSDLNSAVKQQDFPVWTGLHRDGQTWKWSEGVSEYRNWATNEPTDNGDCVTISSLDKKMATQNCDERFPFICLRDNMILVKENKTWEEALEHCRALKSPYHYDRTYELPSVQPEDSYYLTSKVVEANTEELWAGLRFLAGHWLWVNGVDMSYSHLPLCPPEGKHCGALSKNDTGNVEIRDCSEKRNFLCYATL